MAQIEFIVLASLRKGAHGHDVLVALSPFLEAVGDKAGEIDLMYVQPEAPPVAEQRNRLLFDPVRRVLAVRFAGDDDGVLETRLRACMRSLELLSAAGFHYEMKNLETQESWRECFGPSVTATDQYRQDLMRIQAEGDEPMLGMAPP